MYQTLIQSNPIQPGTSNLQWYKARPPWIAELVYDNDNDNNGFIDIVCIDNMYLYICIYIYVVFHSFSDLLVYLFGHSFFELIYLLLYHLSIYFFIYLFIHVLIYLLIYLLIHLLIYLFILYHFIVCISMVAGRYIKLVNGCIN